MLLTATLVNTMARSVGWRRECSNTVRRRIEEALQVKLYIVHQVGPTGFILKEDGRTKKQNVGCQTSSIRWNIILLLKPSLYSRCTWATHTIARVSVSLKTNRVCTSYGELVWSRAGSNALVMIKVVTEEISCTTRQPQ